jgi:putative spermidine/putrescine transport system permease protein
MRRNNGRVSSPLSGLFYAHPNARLWLLLGPPLLWFAVFYVLPLLALLMQSVYTFDELSMTVSRELTLANFRMVFTEPAHLDILLRTFSTALAVTVACATIAYPIAYYMARYASGRTKGIMYVAVMIPMWASYIVKTYAWTVILSKAGIAQWFVSHLGLSDAMGLLLSIPGVGGSTLATSHFGRFLVFTYMWLPFMILPIQASIERISPTLLNASADLGASPAKTFCTVVLPLSVPGVAAGSIFTFCLTFGDYIIPTLIGPSGDFLGTAIYKYQGAIGNIPLAAALTVVPIVVVGAWLWLAKKLGAFDAL